MRLRFFFHLILYQNISSLLNCRPYVHLSIQHDVKTQQIHLSFLIDTLFFYNPSHYTTKTYTVSTKIFHFTYKYKKDGLYVVHLFSTYYSASCSSARVLNISCTISHSSSDSIGVKFRPLLHFAHKPLHHKFGLHLRLLHRLETTYDFCQIFSVKSENNFT